MIENYRREKLFRSNNIKFDSQGYCAYIGVFDDKDYEEFSLIVDTNIAINLEKFYYKPSSLIQNGNNISNEKKTKKWLATIEFLIRNLDKDTIFGFALQESCWDYETRCINDNQYKKMEYALEAENNWTITDILQRAYSNGEISNIHIQRNKVNNISTLIDQKESNPLMLGSYACVLKIMILQCSIKNKGRESCYTEFIQFMTKELSAIHAIEANIATNYFLGEPEMQELGDKIFKFGSKKIPVLLNAWNTCWDIFYLRAFQLAYFGNEIDAYRPKLVTADKGIINIASMISLECVINDKQGYLPLLSFYNENIQEQYKELLTNLEKEIYFSTIDRMDGRCNLDDKVTYLKNIIVKLEIELLELYGK